MSNTIQTKYCPDCKQNKPLSEFNKSRTRKGGFQSYCKSCLKAYQKTYQQSEKGKAICRKATTKYQQTFNYKVVSANYRQSLMGKAAHRKADAKSKAIHPNNIKAKDAVNNAIRAGKLPRPNTWLCHYCTRPAQEYHHWHGYEPEHYLDVIPACRECHKKEHRRPQDANRGIELPWSGNYGSNQQPGR